MADKKTGAFGAENNQNSKNSAFNSAAFGLKKTMTARNGKGPAFDIGKAFVKLGLDLNIQQKEMDEWIKQQSADKQAS